MKSIFGILSLVFLCFFILLPCVGCGGGSGGGGGSSSSGGGSDPQPSPTTSPTVSPTPTPTPTPTPSPSPSPSPSMGKIIVHLAVANGTIGELYKEGITGVFLNFEIQGNLAEMQVEPGNYRVVLNYLGVNYYDPSATTYFPIIIGQEYNSYP